MPNQAKWAIALLVGVGLIFIGWRVSYVLTILHVMLCFLLIVVVLLQSGKAADLAGAFGGAGSQTAFGPRGAATFLSKATTWCAIMFMLTSMTLVLRQDKAEAGAGSILQNRVAKPVPVVPAPQTPPGPIIPQPSGTTTTPSQAPSSTPPPATKNPGKTQPPKK
jgi:preprotein translocase subunit SecG